MVQTRQPIFVQLLHAAFKVSQCAWLNAGQRFNVENCIRTLSDVGKYSSVLLPYKRLLFLSEVIISEYKLNIRLLFFKL